MLSDDLLAWYSLHGRDLPWRRSRDPYAIWVSEIMLQQTRVDTALPYYLRFMDQFPTVKMLARAPLEQVLLVWEGLGYYARARNLHRAAQAVVDNHGERLPQTEKELMALPGIGRYTAAALMAIAFDQDTVALEANLRRVLARLFDVHLDPARPDGERELRRLGKTILPPGKSSEFNQALMDLGALVCTPRTPDCASCPLSRDCLALLHGTQEELPARKQRRDLPLRIAVAAVLLERDSLLITRRPEGGLLGGLWAFPGGFIKDGESNRRALRRVLKEQLDLEVEIGKPLHALAHTYTHFRASLRPFVCGARSTSLREQGHVRWVKLKDLESVPMGKLDRVLATELRRSLEAGEGRAERAEVRG